MIEKYEFIPNKLVTSIIRLKDATSSLERHKILLDLGESLLVYLVAILLGEYRKNELLIESLELEFYRLSSRKMSMGNYQSLLRLLIKNNTQSLLFDRITNKEKYNSIEKFEYEFILLKSVIDNGEDDNFSMSMEKMRKGRTIQKKNMTDFFDTLVSIRNIFAHPEGKAGKTNKRTWPLNDAYFNTINIPFQITLEEIIQDLIGLFETYVPAQIKLIDNQSKKIIYSIDTNTIPTETKCEWGNKNTSFPITINLFYLLDKNNDFFIQLYYGKIPSVPANIAEKIITAEKSRERTPMIKEMIKEKLSREKRIDSLSLLVLKDTAKTNYISEESLFDLIEMIRIEMGIDADTGTPLRPGTIFIKSSSGNSEKNIFNPMLLRYFLLVSRIDFEIMKKEQNEFKQAEKKIENLRKELSQHPIIKLIEKKKNEINKLNLNFIETKNIFFENVKNIQSNSNNYLNTDTQTSQNEISELENKFKINENIFKSNVNNLETEILKLNSTHQLELENKEKEIKLLSQSNLQFYENSIRGNHYDIWQECSQFVEKLIAINLNRFNEDNGKWINWPTAWQQGNLTYNYWGRIHPEKAPLNKIIHVGMAICNELPWMPKKVDESIKHLLIGPSVIICTAYHEKDLFRLGLNKHLMRSTYIQDLVTKFESELIELEVLVVVQHKDHINTWYWDVSKLIPIEKYILEKEQYIVRDIFSKPWKLNDFFTNGVIDIEKLGNFETKVSTLLILFSNAIQKVNDWALIMGINEEFIERQEDNYIRYREHLIREFDLYKTETGNFNFPDEFIEKLKATTEKLFGLDKRLFNPILNKYKSRDSIS